jgi:RNA polymerase sigma-70 factor, ECF subfamily
MSDEPPAATPQRADPLAQILRQIAAGDKSAMAQLFRSLEKPLFAFVQSRLNDSHLSNDIMQDVFLEVWRGAGRFEGRSSVRSWIFGMAWRKVIDVHRANRRLSFSDDLPEMEDEGPAAVALIEQEEDSRRLRGCLEGLKDDHRVAIDLAFYQDLGYREIAEVLGVPEGTVKTRVFHAKKLLLHCLERNVLKGLVQ